MTGLTLGGGRVVSATLATGQAVGCGTLVNAAGPRAQQVAAMAGLLIPVEPRKRYSFVFSSATPIPGRMPNVIGIDCSMLRSKRTSLRTPMARAHSASRRFHSGSLTARARRVDIAWVFLGAWLGLVALRVALLGQPLAVWAHQLGSGALMLFAFFMISDPMTIPNATRGRILYAILVACIAYAWAYVAFRPNALPWALFIATPLVPWIDRLWPAERYEWRGGGSAGVPAPG